MIFTHHITLDLTYNPIKTIDIKQFTKKSFLLHVSLTNKGEPFYADKRTQRCYFKMVTPDKRHIFTDAIIQDGGTVDIPIPESACLAPGFGKAELVFVEAENPPTANNDKESYENSPNDGYVFATMNLRVNIVESSYGNSDITSSDDFDALNKALIAANKTYEEVMESAGSSAENAKKSEENASLHALVSKSYAVGGTGLEREDKSIDENHDNAKYYCGHAQNYYGQTADKAMKAATSETNAAESALLSKSYAVGDTGLKREDENISEDEDNAKHYCKQAEVFRDQVKNYTESLSGVLHPMGTVPFASLPALADTREGAMYNISNEFITDTNFKEGAGHTISAGANVYKTADNKWDILAGTPVTGVKGNSESSYRKGNVNITPENIGAPSNKYISDNFVPGYISTFRSAVANQGWYRIAEANQYGYSSCVISLKRSYNSPGPEYQKIQLMSAYTLQKFVVLAAYSHTHFWTKIREVWDSNNSKAYIEIYQNRNTASNAWQITIEDAISGGSPDWKWKAIEAEATEEAVSGVNVLTSLDLPANFDSDYLARKDGSNVSGTWENLIAGKALHDGDGNVIKDSYAVRKTIANGDFNQITAPGLYTMRSCTQNAPASASYYGLLVLQSDTGNYIEQIAFRENSYDIYIRCLNSSTWTQWQQLVTEANFLDKIYPIGSIYMSVNSTNPATLFGGTWVRWGNGRVPVGVDTSQTEFNEAEKTGGSKYLQKHRHTTTDTNMGFMAYGSGGTIARAHMQHSGSSEYIAITAKTTDDLGYSKTTADEGTGGSGNLQPFITCYMWKRTA